MDNNRLKKIISKSGLSLPEFAKKVGISRNTLIRYRDGQTSPPVAFLEKVCEGFSVNPGWLILGQGDPDRLLEQPDLALTKADLALIRALRVCGEEYTKRIYIAVTVRAQNVLEEKELKKEEKQKIRKDIDELSLALVK